MSNRYAVIMAGGRGSRFWPKSRLKKPKHLVPIVGDKPMLQQTVERLGNEVPLDNIFIITNELQLDGVRECCPTLKVENIIAEPAGRDTTAVVGLAMLLIKQRDLNGIFVMLPADQVIHDATTFQKTLDEGFRLADADAVLVTLGIKPSSPATGYGYIKTGKSRSKIGENAVYDVEMFVEKPDLLTAQQYVDSGKYFWNAGMFIWSVSTIEKELKEKTPELYKSIQIIEQRYQLKETLVDILEDVYPTIQRISVDYAIMEKANNVVMIEASFDWDDVGAWPALDRHVAPDDYENVILGDVIIEKSSKSIIISNANHLTAVIGVDNLIVVQTEDATLICSKDRAQDIKHLVDEIAQDPKHKHLL